MDMVTCLWIVVGLLSLTVLILGLRLRKIEAGLASIGRVLEDIRDGNESRKLLARQSEPTAGICYQVNDIVASYRARLQKMEQAEKTQKQMLTGFSHDVRTPLTSLIGYLDAIDTHIVEGEEKDAYLEIARKKAYDLKEFVDLLFEWFKLDAGERAFHFEPADVFELTRLIAADWIPVFEGAGMAFFVDIPEEEHLAAVDVSAFTRIVNNLLQNSLVHSHAHQVGIRLAQKQAEIQIDVFDDGEGIPEAELPMIFDRLYKCDPSRANRGSGLGLSIARELVEAHRGTISAASIPGQATTFTILLPREGSPKTISRIETKAGFPPASPVD
jgi:signal transduction histidine kinase